MVRIVAAILCFGAAAAHAESAPPKLPLVLGINKAVGAVEAERAEALLPRALGDLLGREVRVVVTPDYEGLVAGLLLGKIDVAWMSPLAFVQARQGDKAITPLAKAVRHNALYYRAVIVVRKGDGAPKSVKELKGKKIAWVSKSSTSGYLFPRALLKRQSIDADAHFGEQTMAGTHDAACTLLLEGKVDAAATFADEPPEGADFRADGCAGVGAADKVSIVLKTGPISNDVLVVRPGFNAAEAKGLAEKLTQLKNTEAGQKALKEAFRAEGFGLVQDADFDPIEQAAKLVESASAEDR